MVIIKVIHTNTHLMNIEIFFLSIENIIIVLGAQVRAFTYLPEYKYKKIHVTRINTYPAPTSRRVEIFQCRIPTSSHHSLFTIASPYGYSTSSRPETRHKSMQFRRPLKSVHFPTISSALATFRGHVFPLLPWSISRPAPVQHHRSSCQLLRAKRCAYWA